MGRIEQLNFGKQPITGKLPQVIGVLANEKQG